MPQPRIEPGTFQLQGRCADHYTMRSRLFKDLSGCYLLLCPNATLKLIQNCIQVKQEITLYQSYSYHAADIYNFVVNEFDPTLEVHNMENEVFQKGLVLKHLICKQEQELQLPLGIMKWGPNLNDYFIIEFNSFMTKSRISKVNMTFQDQLFMIKNFDLGPKKISSL